MIERILEIMQARGVKAATLLRDTGLSSSAITDWKKRKANPSYGALVKIANYFEVSIEYLQGKTNDPSLLGEKKELTYRDKLVQEMHDILKTVPDEKLEKFKALLKMAIDTTN